MKECVMDVSITQQIEDLTELLSCRNCPSANTTEHLNLPGRKAIIEVLKDLISVLFPGCHAHTPIDVSSCKGNIATTLQSIAERLTNQIQRIYEYSDHHGRCRTCTESRDFAQTAVSHLFTKLPALRTLLQDDIQAAYEGDPAARSHVEIVMSYPGLYAVVVHRIAHLLYLEKVHLLPRVMSEYAHSRTGIDIHPGATIGSGFFIDHGTGVVIGETCTIGSHVKIYQGVTLGALSFAKDDDGQLIKGIKRHPNVEDNVIIYAGATILGGETTIGHDSIIGGNVWLISSVSPYTMIYNQPPTPQVKHLSECRCNRTETSL